MHPHPGTEGLPEGSQIMGIREGACQFLIYLKEFFYGHFNDFMEKRGILKISFLKVLDNFKTFLIEMLRSQSKFTKSQLCCPLGSGKRFII